jgi:hypothetical protein
MEIDGLCGGPTTVTITGTTNYQVYFGDIASQTIGEGPCDGYTVDVTGGVSGVLTADTVSFVMPNSLCGKTAQIIDLDTCETTDLEVLPTEDAFDAGYEDGYEDGTLECLEDGGALWDTITAAYDDGYSAGESSVDITSDNADVYDDGYDAGYAAAPTPESNDASIEQALCESDAVGGTWNASAGSCTAAVCAYSDADADGYDDTSFEAGADTPTFCLSVDEASGGGSRIVEVVIGNIACAALAADGSVVTWGSGPYGGDSSDVEGLTDVQTIFSVNGAFAALKTDGTVVTWGSSVTGGDSSDVAADLIDVQTIFSANTAFAALKTDGSVVTWGDSGFGGDSSAVASELTGVETIFSTRNAFAALKTDGSVVTWGYSDYGGDSSAVAADLTDVEAVYGNPIAFAALKTDGSVVTWGDYGTGANSSAVASELAGVNEVIWALYPPEVGGPCAGDVSVSPESYCGDGTTWDAAAGTCTAAAAEESMNCFQSGFCQAADDLYGTGLPNSIVGNATEAECSSFEYPGGLIAWIHSFYAAQDVAHDGEFDMTLMCE